MVTLAEIQHFFLLHHIIYFCYYYFGKVVNDQIFQTYIKVATCV